MVFFYLLKAPTGRPLFKARSAYANHSSLQNILWLVDKEAIRLTWIFTLSLARDFANLAKKNYGLGQIQNGAEISPACKCDSP